MTLSIQYLYYLVGAVLALTAIATVTDRSNPKRVSSGLFWGLYALVFLVGDQLPPLWVGVGAVAAGAGMAARRSRALMRAASSRGLKGLAR